MRALLEQRVYGLICGYEDLNDHDRLRTDPAFQVLAGKVPELGAQLAGRNTLNRLELSRSKIEDGERYKKIACDDQKVQAFFIEEFVRYAKRRKLKKLPRNDAPSTVLRAKCSSFPLFCTGNRSCSRVGRSNYRCGAHRTLGLSRPGQTCRFLTPSVRRGG